MKAKLILENGMVFEGKAFGYLKEAVGEVVFNTSMAGYQEILTDPSYFGQIVTMTYPLIGNYGTNLDDLESANVKVKGFIVRECCKFPNNWRCEFELDEYLKRNRVIGLEGIDTRALTKVIRNHGVMKGVIAVRDLTKSQVASKLDSYHNILAVREVTNNDIRTYEGSGKHIGIIDFGIKNSTLKLFKDRGYQITIFPPFTKAEEILAYQTDGLFLSSGPGDPKNLMEVVEEIKKIIGKKPITGISLGHQLLALALGGERKKMKSGHRGTNHPVKDQRTNKVLITSQDHGYVVDDKVLGQNVEITHININDGTVEGMKSRKHRIFSIQFNPETKDVFDELLEVFEDSIE